MNNQKAKTLLILVAAILIMVHADAVQAKDKIVWPYVCFKPTYICHEGQLTGGSGFHILNLLWQRMPAYEHELMMMPVKRILESAKEGNHQLFYGLYKTPERDLFLHYSIPCRISIPPFLVIRKEDLPLFGGGKPLLLKKLLEDRKKTFLYFQSISFGKRIDEVLTQYMQKQQVLTEYETTDLVSKSLTLLLNKRVDYMLSVDGTQNSARDMGVSDKIAYISFEEQDNYEIGYITAPKNEWGIAVINQVNAILRKAILTEDFFQYFAPLVDETMLPQLRQHYNESILSPAKQAP